MMQSEQELAAQVVKWLEARGWDVYQEVGLLRCVADIVALKQGQCWIIEVKTSFGLSVLTQAWHWVSRKSAHKVSVATPRARNWNQRHFAEQVAGKFGIGVIYVDFSGPAIAVEAELLEESPHRCMREELRPEHKTYAKAGSQNGGQFTEFKATLAKVQTFVKENPGCTGRQLAEGIKHHYASNASARSTLVKLGKTGQLDGLRVDGKPASFFVEEKA